MNKQNLIKHNISLSKITGFLESININYTIVDKELDSFLKGITIENGSLKINLDQLLCPGDILHEAGHLALLPSEIRDQANGNISDSIGDQYTYELGVILWTVAAAIHLEIPLTEIFHNDAYKGNAGWFREQFESKNFIGLPLLQWMEMTAFDIDIEKGKAKPFPAMLCWTRA